MKVLFIGGTGVITTDTAKLAVERGMDVTLLNRGNSKLAPAGARQLQADIYDRDRVLEVIGDETFDVVLDCISYDVRQLRHKLELFRGRYQQFIFISSTAVYAVGAELPISEDKTPLGNFGWDYGCNKAACEYELAREDFLYGCNYTIVRPGETYNDLRVPMSLVANPYHGGYTMLDRIRKGKPIIVHDDGSTFATFTHATDIAKGIVGLFMNEKAYGEAYHITCDETYTWLELTKMVGEAAGAETNIVFVPTRELCLAMPSTPHGDTYGVFQCAKAFSESFDNTKIRSVVPDFNCEVSLAEGLARTVAFYDTHPEYQVVSPELNADIDRVAAMFS